MGKYRTDYRLLAIRAAGLGVPAWLLVVWAGLASGRFPIHPRDKSFGMALPLAPRSRWADG